MAFEEGKSGNPNGRPKGAVGKLNASFKELVQRTFQKLEEDGDGMYEWAKANKTDFYKISSKLIPTEMAIKADITQIEIEKTIITHTPFIELPPGSVTDESTPNSSDEGKV